MIQRLTRAERKERTREELLSAAVEVFLRRGFHGASLDEIAEEAGYTKGAVYSNFVSKDELFLAVLDARYDERMRLYTDGMLDEERMEDSIRAAARVMFEEDRAEPRWAALLLEFWAHASRREELRVAVVARRERFLERLAALIAGVLNRHGASVRLPVLEVARASGGLMRGIGIEWLLEPENASLERFEEIHLALMLGLMQDVEKGDHDVRTGDGRHHDGDHSR